MSYEFIKIFEFETLFYELEIHCNYLNENTFLFRPHDSGNISLLTKKYAELHKQVIGMTTTMVSPRPTCEQMLDEKNLWALSLIELKEDLNRFKKENKTIEESFHHFFIQTKLEKINLDLKKDSLLTKSLNYLKKLF